MRRSLTPILSLLSLLAAVSHLRAQDVLEPLSAETPPVIDGVLDDAVWQDAPYVTGFKTFRPDFGRDMVGETRAYMAYDRENLYFAFRAFDGEPDKIKTSITSRDNLWRDDWICINLDSFNDQQSLYALYVNPAGVQGDSRFAAGVEDRSVDLVWFSEGRIDDEGYTVEVKLPLQSIRFADTEPVTMGVIFERHVARRSEQGTYPPLDPARGDAWLTQMKPMVYYDLSQSRLFEILPAVTYSHRRAQNEGRLETAEERGDFSLTTKYGLTSDLVFDATYNPDFSQIEADAGQVDINLRYDLFFPEKRPFFLEGRENFTVASTGASERDPVISIVYTRTIVDPIVGAKLTGKLGARNTLASIYALDELPDLEPVPNADYAHVPIVRYKRTLAEDSYVGGIYAGRELRHHYNRLAGLDGQIRTGESSLLRFHTLMSRAKQDSTSAETNGHAVSVDFNNGTRDLDYSVAALDVSEEFRAEMGFIARTGILQFSGLLRPKFYPDSDVLRRVDLELFSAQTKDHFYDLWETFNHISVRNQLWGSLSLQLKYSYSTEIFLGERFRTGGIQVFGGGQFTNELYLGVLYRNVDAIFYSAEPYQGRSHRLNAELIYQPFNKLRGELSFIYYDFYRDSDSQKIYDYPIGRFKLTYQLNKYLFFRGILEYNDFRSEMLTDFLASFTYIPGTVVHFGYGSLFDKTRWRDGEYIESDSFRETKRSLFLKLSYLWRV